MSASRHLRPRTPLLPAGGRRRRAVQLVALCALVGASLPVAGGTAQAVPEQVLQTVRVEVGPDGSITAVQSQAVRRAGDADPTSEEQSLDPTAVAGDLPVRVLTSYRLGERSGTDLRDIEGESGRVVVRVTVQNTTVRPEVLEHEDADGDLRTTTALVGTPLTVVGSAQLGEGELARVVTRNDDDPSEVTDGVVSRADDGRARVQWAAMLAPPRLAASTTFTLVEETADFEVPSFDFAVQPGLVTDASLERLVDSAFSDDRGSTLQLETRTISLIGSVNTVLADAGGVLVDIGSTLDRAADDLGRRTVGELRAGRDRVDDSLTDAVDQLDRLDADIERELDATGDATLEGLGGTLDRVRVLLGDPGERRPTLRFDGGCNDRVPATEPGVDPATTTSVLYRMRLVGEQLKALTQVSGACTRQIQDGLRRTIGVRGECADPARATTAICTLEATIVELGEQAGEIAAFGTSLKELADPDDSIAALGTRLRQVTATLGTLQATTGDIRDQGLLAGDLVDAARAIDDQLAALGAGLGGLSLDGVLGNYRQINTIADEQLAILGSEGLAGTVAGRVDALTGRLVDLCGLGGIDLSTLPTDLPAALLAFLGGSSSSCSGVGGLVTSLEAQLAQLTSGWDRVADLSDVSGNGALGQLQDAVDDLVDDLNAARGQVQRIIDRDDESSDAEAELDDLLDVLDGWYDAGLPADPDPCTATPPSGRPQVNQVEDAFATVACNSEVLQGEIDTRMADLTRVVDDASGDVGSSRDEAESARRRAEVEVADLTGKLGRRIDDAGRDVTRRVEAKVSASRRELTARENAARDLLSRLTRSASDRLSDQVSASNRDLGATNRQLQADLAAVLADLGTRGSGGTGILGTLSTSARRTGLSNADLTGARKQASAFRSIRGEVVADIRLQQAQTDRSLELAEQLPSLGLDVPEGSRVLTVYSFHLGA